MQGLSGYLVSKRAHISRNYHRDLSVVLESWSREFVTLDSVSTQSLQEWADNKLRTVKPSTVAAYLFSIRKYYDWLIIHQIVSGKNPVIGVTLPRHRKPFRRVFVSRDTACRLITECTDAELKYILFCGFHSGLRFGEVVASRPEWFSLPDALLHVTRCEDWDTKDHEDRTIPLTDAFLAFLRVYGLPSPYMLYPEKRVGGRHRYRYDFKRKFYNYLRRKNVRMTFHDCRRTFASLHASAGTSIYKIAKWLGDDVGVVQRHYGHLEPRDTEINRAFVA